MGNDGTPRCQGRSTPRGMVIRYPSRGQREHDVRGDGEIRTGVTENVQDYQNTSKVTSTFPNVALTCTPCTTMPFTRANICRAMATPSARASNYPTSIKILEVLERVAQVSDRSAKRRIRCDHALKVHPSDYVGPILDTTKLGFDSRSPDFIGSTPTSKNSSEGM